MGKCKMVDIDELDNQKSKSSGSKKKKKSKSKSSSSKSQQSTGGDPYSQDPDGMIDPEGKEVGRVAQDWADEGADLNHHSGTSGTLGEYEQRQIKEVKELHNNIYEMSTDNMSDFNEFTIYFHALFINLARNRVGVAEALQDNFNMSKKESVQKAGEISKKAGEDEMISKLINEMTENLAGM